MLDFRNQKSSFFIRISEMVSENQQFEGCCIRLAPVNRVPKGLRQIAPGFNPGWTQTFESSPEGAKGGDLGYFEAEELPVEFAGIFKLKGNQISEVIHTPRGYHIFKVIVIIAVIAVLLIVT